MTQPILVDLPSKQTARKKHKNGTIYVYYRSNFRRNDQGKAIFDEMAIGKLDESGEKLIPNRNYYDLFPDSSDKYVKSVKTLGLPFVLYQLVKDLKLDVHLTAIFGSTSQEILALAFYVLAQGNVIAYAQDWMEERIWPEESPSLSSQKISRLFESISYAQRLAFFESWTKQHSQQEYWYYDVTSISSYSRQIDFLEWGYNRDGESLPQLNVGMCYGASTKLPLFYQAYNGSIPDKVYFLFLLRDLSFLDTLLPIYLVTDQGFITRDNLQATGQDRSDFRLLSALPLYMKDAQRILANHGPSLKQDAHYLMEEQVYGCLVSDTVFDQPVRIYLYYDPEKAANDIKQFYESLSRTEEELKAMKSSQLRRKKYKDYFKIEIQNEQSFTYERDSQAIDHYLEKCGYYILLSTGPDLHPSQALYRYRQKDRIEKQFDSLKNDIDYRRLKTHSRNTTEGKLFIGFIALILRSQIHKLLESLPKKERPTLTKIMMELEKIKVVETKEGKYLLTPLTKKQKEILSAFHVSAHDLMKRI